MPIAMYQRIAEEITQQIRSGEIPVGALLPTEFTLMESYETSRNTVRTALQQLQARGLISRRRNRGTMVEALPGGTATFTQALTFENLVTLASTAQRTMLASKDVVLDINLAKLLQCQPGSLWHRLSMVRSVEGKARPLGWTDAYVDLHYRQLGELAKQQPSKLLADIVETEYGRRIESVEQTVSCCAVSDDMEQVLGAPRGTPALRVLKHYRDSARALVIVTNTLYPENRFSILTTLVRSS